MPKAQQETKKVFVGLSGGVDSAVSAALLKEQGYEVTGVFMKNWSGDDYGIQADCPWEEDQQMAELVCRHLNIAFRSYNFEKQYREKVVEYFFSEFSKGRTPNPDVMCNKEIKFDLFLQRALADGADYIATGHYARVVGAANERFTADSSQLSVSGARSGITTVDRKPITVNYHLLKGIDSNKDQTYFLYNLTQEQLSHTLFPIGHLPKPEVRKLAHQFELPNAERPDSQGICFIGEIDLYKFLRSRIPLKQGNIIDVDTGEKVGEHDGVYFYTIGQREGLGIGGQIKPYYVVSKDIEQNILYVGAGRKHAELFHQEIELESLHLILDAEITTDKQLSASIRYRQKPQLGHLDQQSMKFIFNEPQRAVTSGQSLVLYDGDVCLGGGVIK